MKEEHIGRKHRGTWIRFRIKTLFKISEDAMRAPKLAKSRRRPVTEPARPAQQLRLLRSSAHPPSSAPPLHGQHLGSSTLRPHASAAPLVQPSAPRAPRQRRISRHLAIHNGDVEHVVRREGSSISGVTTVRECHNVVDATAVVLPLRPRGLDA